jgi:hypothetical protein
MVKIKRYTNGTYYEQRRGKQVTLYQMYRKNWYVTVYDCKTGKDISSEVRSKLYTIKGNTELKAQMRLL